MTCSATLSPGITAANGLPLTKCTAAQRRGAARLSSHTPSSLQQRKWAVLLYKAGGAAWAQAQRLAVHGHHPPSLPAFNPWPAALCISSLRRILDS
jgi:hypothetical protein